jgi:hypothetical protein
LEPCAGNQPDPGTRRYRSEFDAGNLMHETRIAVLTPEIGKQIKNDPQGVNHLDAYISHSFS